MPKNINARASLLKYVQTRKRLKLKKTNNSEYGANKALVIHGDVIKTVNRNIKSIFLEEEDDDDVI